ncbi:MAG: hypothetical protein EBQ92_00745 [Proteobacteria bacterium]|nr:hypothetical protein [Pseudomonadota bacterium]
MEGSDIDSFSKESIRALPETTSVDCLLNSLEIGQDHVIDFLKFLSHSNQELQQQTQASPPAFDSPYVDIFDSPLDSPPVFSLYSPPVSPLVSPLDSSPDTPSNSSMNSSPAPALDYSPLLKQKKIRAKKQPVDTSSMTPEKLKKYKERREKNTKAAKKNRQQKREEKQKLMEKLKNLNEDQPVLLKTKKKLLTYRTTLLEELRSKLPKNN